MKIVKIKQILSLNNIKKAYRYCKKNGISQAFYAVIERMSRNAYDVYSFQEVSDEELCAQREKSKNFSYKFSILVPAYETKEEYLRQMLESVLKQSYPNVELVIADASKSNAVEKVVREYQQFEKEKIIYKHLEKNAGISENTNEALKMATGDYIGLLDHDDVLTGNALYEAATSLEMNRKMGISVDMLYSDEDKGDGELHTFFEPHKKDDFNLDLFLSNNYICHFALIRKEVMQALRFRKEYDGAQDYDLFLRVVSGNRKSMERIVHIPQVLYHWRCHADSTSANPESKMYAYEAGRRAVQDFAQVQGWRVCVEHTTHLGFYRIQYGEDIFRIREDVAAIGGPIFKKGKVVQGAMDESGAVLFKGLSKHFTGYMHRAVLQQNVWALDIRNMLVREEWLETYHKILKQFHIEVGNDENGNRDAYVKAALAFAEEVNRAGFCMQYDPKKWIKEN